MTKRFLATLLAATIALTSVSAAPAIAGDRDKLGKFLLGAGALIIIGSAISNKNRHRDSDHVVTRRHVEPTHRVKPRRKVVPSACLRVNRSDHGPRRYFGRRCLNNNMHHAGRLPGSCIRQVWTRNGHRSVYGARCLRNNGWVFG